MRVGSVMCIILFSNTRTPAAAIGLKKYNTHPLAFRKCCPLATKFRYGGRGDDPIARLTKVNLFVPHVDIFNFGSLGQQCGSAELVRTK